MAQGASLPTLRLLTAVPRLEGLAAPLPSKGRRRPVELVAYLALHHPQPVTGERLRMRVLGSGGRDARPKTLFNVAGQARRALGADAGGAPLLARSDATGLYRLSAALPVDTVRAVTLTAAGDRSPSRAEAMARYQEALALVEGEPLAGVRRGYGWWTVEGHELPVVRALVRAACRLVELAAPGGDVDVARWAIEQARLVEPDSEALSRAAMVVAAERGDLDDLRRAWRDCRHRLTDDDPELASLPSHRTEQLYRRLATELRATEPAGLQATELRATEPAGPQAAGGPYANLAAMDEALRSTVPSAPAAL